MIFGKFNELNEPENFFFKYSVINSRSTTSDLVDIRQSFDKQRDVV